MIRRFTRRWNDGGVASIEDLLHPEVEWVDPPELPGGGVHVGREATMSFLREWEGSLGVLRLHFHLDEILECPDGYLSVSTAHGSGEGGVPIPPHQWFHWLKL